MEYYPTSKIDFDSIDWVDLALKLGFRMPTLNDGKIEITKVGTPYKLYMYAITMVSRMFGERYPLELIYDELTGMVREGQLTNFDKATIKIYMSRIMRQNKSIQH